MASQPQMRAGKSGGLPLGQFMLWTVIISVLVIGAWAIFRLTPLLETAKAVMSLYDPKLAWYFARSAGIVSYVLLSISVMWGLVLSTKITKEITPAPAVLALHNAVSWIAVGVGAIHGFSLMLDTYYTYDLFDILIPFTGPYRPGWVGLGVLSLYVMLVASASFRWKEWLGQKGWKWVHFSTFPVYGLLTLHGLMAGTDSWQIGTNAMYLGSVLLVLFLTNYRVMAGKEAASARRSAAATRGRAHQVEEASAAK